MHTTSPIHSSTLGKVKDCYSIPRLTAMISFRHFVVKICSFRWRCQNWSASSNAVIVPGMPLHFLSQHSHLLRICGWGSTSFASWTQCSISVPPAFIVSTQPVVVDGHLDTR